MKKNFKFKECYVLSKMKKKLLKKKHKIRNTVVWPISDVTLFFISFLHRSKRASDIY